MPRDGGYVMSQHTLPELAPECAEHCQYALDVCAEPWQSCVGVCQYVNRGPRVTCAGCGVIVDQIGGICERCAEVLASGAYRGIVA
jgi:hypothetical protein